MATGSTRLYDSGCLKKTGGVVIFGSASGGL